MIRLRTTVMLAAIAAMLASTPAFAVETGARFGGSVYENRPKLPNTLALVVAGGGPKRFSAARLFGVLAGPLTVGERAKLVKRFTQAGFDRYVKTFDFVIDDSLAIVTAAKVKLPTSPSPDPADGAALTSALYKDGVDPARGFNVEYMLDHLVTHPVHVRVMKDIDARYGAKADADYHAITLQLFKDLKKAYKL